MVKGTMMFILGATVGVIGCGLADSPLDPLHEWLVTKECEAHYAKELNMTPQEFATAIASVRK